MLGWGLPRRDAGQALRAAGGREGEGAAVQGLFVLPWAAKMGRVLGCWAPVGFLALCPQPLSSLKSG